ncbi:MAG: hypothetical protein KF684_04240 [Phycisphaeraceae bacterium]|nr:hypothetical protein [Phycisphaeraceae bacterium]
MNTSTHESNTVFLERLREENAGILERVRERAVEGKPAEVELLHDLGRVLDALDAAMREAIADAPDPALYPDDEGIIDDAPMRILADLVADRTAAGIDERNDDDPLAILVRRARAALALNGIARIPSADELFATRGIVVYFTIAHDGTRGWVAGAKTHHDNVELAYVLGSDGWSIWGGEGDAMFFTTELEARAAAAATPLPDEQPALPAPRFAVILVHDGVLPGADDLAGDAGDQGAVTIAATFEPNPVDLSTFQGAHRAALDMLRFVGAGCVIDAFADAYPADKSARDFGVAPAGGGA